MSDDPEVIRQQMAETKTQLVEKLETLEQQVSDTVQSTGTAVTATVGAVQETVGNVTDAVHDAVEKMSHAFDIRRQMDRHPWLVLGGAVLVGGVAHHLLTSPSRKALACPPDEELFRDYGSRLPNARPSAAIAAAYQSGLKQSYWNQLTSMAIGTLGGIVKEFASQTLPQLVAELTNADTHPSRKPEELKTKPHDLDLDATSPTARVYTPSAERIRTTRAF